MEFTKYKCPVCNEQFKSGEDIVVCPECGAPHHRECYEKIGHCFYEDKHSDDFSYENLFEDNNNKSEAETNDSDFIVCPICKYENEKTMFYCDRCGYPLNEQDRKNFTGQNVPPNQNVPPKNNNAQFNQNMPPFGFGVNGVNPFDPLAGLNSEQEIAENVKVGEMAKFVGKSTQYFLMTFNKIKSTGSSRINFSAFLFSGLYFLYRKMTALGIFITLAIIALTVGETLIQITPQYMELYNSFYEMYTSSTSYYNIMSLTSAFTIEELLFLYTPLFLVAIKGLIMLFCGLFANKIYYKHCTKKINSIKKKSGSVNINKELENSGGINLALAVCFGIAYTITSYIPLFFNYF